MTIRVDRGAARAPIVLTVCAITLAILSGCGIEVDDNYDDVPTQGKVIAVEANQHDGAEEVQVAAALFIDGKSVKAVGGNLFKAANGSSEVLLRDRGPVKGSYAASLAIEDLGQGIEISIVHEPLEARDERWYPIDLMNVDPGPGELVGPVATAFLPPGVTITGPVALSEYTNLNDLVDLTWVDAGEGDTMVLRTTVSCTDGLAVTTYGTEKMLGDDDGIESLMISEFIADLDEISPILNFIRNEAQAMMQELLDKLSNGNIDPDYFARRATVNPVTALCEIGLYLFRTRDGLLNLTFNSGVVRGSSSQLRTIVYRSPMFTAPES